jgi:Domain of unknown function (DUF4062)
VKVFISSVRQGLEAERDALRGLILGLGHEPSRYEDYTALPVPSREACLQGVHDSDVYVLLLGERYGEPLPDTGFAPTEEEFVAARAKGIPVLTFVKRGAAPDDRQRAFTNRVSSYVEGRFRKSFEGVPDLLAEVGEAIRQLASRPPALAWTDLPTALSVPWRRQERSFLMTSGTELATYVLTVGASSRLTATAIAALPDRLARAGRDASLFGQDRSLAIAASDSAASAEARREGRLPGAGLQVTRDRSVVVWQDLPTDMLGAILDGRDVGERVASALQLAAELSIIGATQAAVAVGLTLGSMTAIGDISDLDRRSRAQPIGFGGGTAVIEVDASDSVPTQTLGSAAREIGREMATRLLARATSAR